MLETDTTHTHFESGKRHAAAAPSSVVLTAEQAQSVASWGYFTTLSSLSMSHYVSALRTLDSAVPAHLCSLPPNMRSLLKVLCSPRGFS